METEHSELHCSTWSPALNKSKIKCTLVYHQNSGVLQGGMVFVCSTQIPLARLKKVFF